MILAFSIFPQVLNWKIDYTATSGQLLRDNILVSTIFQAQQPIGLYSHRGHAAFVLAAVVILAIVAWQWRWISDRNFIICLVLIIPALLLTQTRAAVLALLVATAYLLGRKYYKLLIPVALICLVVIGITTSTRQIAGLPAIKQITSDRIYLWQLSGLGIVQRPLLGWGFDGFGIAYPYIYNQQWTPRIVQLNEFSFDYVNKEGQVGTKPIISSKAHNLILDKILSVGVAGMLCYGALLSFCLWRVMLSPSRGMEVVAYCYLLFTLTWFECAQFTYLAWWALSFNVRNEENNRSAT